MKYALLLLLAGCAAAEVPNDWRRDGSTPEQLFMERGQCRAQAMSVPEQANVNAVVVAVFRACMEGKGWHDVAH